MSEGSYATVDPRLLVFGNTLNQVWITMLDHAIDALHGQGTISIRTRQEQGNAIARSASSSRSGFSPSSPIESSMGHTGPHHIPHRASNRGRRGNRRRRSW